MVEIVERGTPFKTATGGRMVVELSSEILVLDRGTLLKIARGGSPATVVSSVRVGTVGGVLVGIVTVGGETVVEEVVSFTGGETVGSLSPPPVTPTSSSSFTSSIACLRDRSFFTTAELPRVAPKASRTAKHITVLILSTRKRERK